MFLAIDPGANPGWCVLDEKGKVRNVGVELPPNALWFGYPIRSAVIELPMIYPGTPPGKANDLIMLATRMGRAADRFGIPESKMFWPTTWKGGISKEKHHPRIWAALDPNEQSLVAERLKGIPKKKVEDAMDSVGLAKWAWENGKF